MTPLWDESSDEHWRGQFRIATLVPVPVREIVRALEREAGNTDTDPRWLAASALRRMAKWEDRTLMCEIDQRPSELVGEKR